MDISSFLPIETSETSKGIQDLTLNQNEQSQITNDSNLTEISNINQKSIPIKTNTKNKPTLENFLNKQLCITLIDKRIIIGYLICIDKEKNIILNDSLEFKPFYPLGVSSSNFKEWDKFRINRETFWPISEPFTFNSQVQIIENDINLNEIKGWGNRSIGMICIKGKDILKIEINQKLWINLGGDI
ncbi:uncharacterized protein I206_100775 [Kwoniella pini CBS 10737]|uniref:Sm domain-containing protein n=1 Tax=Kwoniella pini CBS 10737 TaxID=1296096 RepID=A0A1B9ICX4_9TREE|nr:uncharacterized protein I206_00552 [Kwoniella pini CBS 10737]OCF53251.1 hypothetical protein I206_00552 [Kwoniella pini CBS 10737]